MVGTQNNEKMKKGSKHTTEESHQTTKEKSKIGRKTQTNIKSEGMKEMFHANGNQRKARIVCLYQTK